MRIVDNYSDRVLNLSNIIDDIYYDYFNMIIATKPEHKTYCQNLKYTGYDFYSDFLTISYHKKITSFVSSKIGKELVPTYCFTRLYLEGSLCKMHTDRPECEVSVTYCHYGGPWGIIINGVEYISRKGVGFWYYGIDELHGREKPNDGPVLQTFFHWVIKNGKYSDRAYDNNPNLKKLYEI